MDIRVTVREQLVDGQEYRYNLRPDLCITVRNIDCPGDGLIAAKRIVRATIGADYLLKSAGLESRDRVNVVIAAKRLGRTAEPGRVMRPWARTAAKLEARRQKP